MTIEDVNIQDPSYTTPGGQPLPMGARNPHLQTDIIHGAGSGTSTIIQPAELLYDYIEVGKEVTKAIVDSTMQSATLEYSATYHPSGQGVVFGPLTQIDDVGQATIQISGLVVGATVYVYSAFYMYDPVTASLFSYYIESTGNITQPEGTQMSFIATAETETLTITMTGQVHDAVDFYNATAAYISAGSCTPFFRSINDGVVTDTTLDGQPYIVQGEVRTSCDDGLPEPCPCASQFESLNQTLTVISTKTDEIASTQAQLLTIEQQPFCIGLATVDTEASINDICSSARSLSIIGNNGVPFDMSTDGGVTWNTGLTIGVSYGNGKTLINNRWETRIKPTNAGDKIIISWEEFCEVAP